MMKSRMTPAHGVVATAILALALSACSNPQAVMTVAPKAPSKKVPAVAPQLLPVPQARANSFTATTAGGNLSGSVELDAIDESYYANSAASYRVTALPVKLGNAMITLSTLDEDIYTKDGTVIDGLTDLTGAFTFAGMAPKDKPYYVVNANFVQSHRLSAIVIPDGSGNASGVKLDEASTAIAETARWQLSTVGAAQSSLLSTIYTNTAAILGNLGLATDGGAIPNVDALKMGAGHVLRNAYVEAFGKAVTTGGSANADQLSDAWQTLLGFRPLGVSRVVGNGNRGSGQSDGMDPTGVPMMMPQDAAYDHLGNLFIVEQDRNEIRLVPKTISNYGRASGMTAGKIYSVVGQAAGSLDVPGYNQYYGALEAPAKADPTQAPDISTVLLGLPTRLAVQRVGSTASSNLFFSSKFTNRVYMISGDAGSGNVTAFGRTYPAGKLVTIAGNSTVGAPGQGDGVDGRDFALNTPTGLTLDKAGNVYVLDSAEGKVRVIMNAGANAGKLYTLNLQEPGGSAAFVADGGNDLKVVDADNNPTTAPNWLYVADTGHHRVVRVDLGDLTTLDARAATPVQVAVVLGVKDEPGYIRAGMTYPDIHDVSKALAAADARLNAPSSLEFDNVGNMIVADRGRLHMMEAAGLDPAATTRNTYVIGGGLDTRYISGDSRLCYFPAGGLLHYDGVNRNLLVIDPLENRVRCLWTARGVY